MPSLLLRTRRPLLGLALVAALASTGLGVTSAQAAGSHVVVATVPVAAGPFAVAVDPSTNTAYVASPNSNSVSVIDGTTRSVTATIPVAAGPFGIAVDSSTHTVYVTSNNSNLVSVIDGTTDTVTATIPVGSGPYAIAVDSSTHTVYVTNSNASSVSVIDGTTNTVTGTVPVGPEPYGVAVDPSTHTAYVASYSGSSVAVIDGTTTTRTATVAVGSGPFSVGVDPTTHTVYTGNLNHNSVSVIDGTTNAVTATIPVAGAPYGVGVDSSTHTVYVTSAAEDSVSVIDGTTNVITETVPLGSGAYGAATDPSTQTTYVANYGPGLVSIIAAPVSGDATVADIAALQTAGSTCTGTVDDPATITLAADIADPGAELRVGCHAVLDLAGHDLTVRNVTIAGAQALTIDDTGVGGTLTANASGTPWVAGIENTGATVTIRGGAVSARGGDYASGIGGDLFGSGGTTVVHGGSVTTAGGIYGAGIGGGYEGSGGTTVVEGGTLDATGGYYSAAIGNTYHGQDGGTTSIHGGVVTVTGGVNGAGIGGGHQSAGGTTVIDGGTVIATGGTSALGAGEGSNEFGTLAVDGGVLRLPSGFLRVPDSASGAEITIGPDGEIDGSAGPDPTYATIVGQGQIDDGGRILLPTSRVTGGDVTVLDRHYAVDFDTHGGSAAPDQVTVFADTFTNGDRAFPADPTRAGSIFTGWNSAADGSGDPVTATSTLPGGSADGGPVQISAHAQWQAGPEVSGVAPATGPLAGGTEVVITGTGFTGVTRVDFGSTGQASFTVDSDTQITAVSPPSAVSVTRNILVRSPAGISPAVVAGRFTYGVVPAVTGIAPSSGPLGGGTEVVITGSGFTGVSRVSFGSTGQATSFTVDSDTQITAVSPPSATNVTRNILVRNLVGTSPSVVAGRFTYGAAPVVTGIAPSSGPLRGGTEVVITGTGFAGATKVTFGGIGTVAFVVDSDSQVTAVSPATTSRMTRHVRVRTAVGTSDVVLADRFTWQ